MKTERIENSAHSFWLHTCGIDTYRRSKNHARNDTPWNAFSKNTPGLVNSLWVDRIVEIHDAHEGRTRRFVRLGAKMAHWQGLAIAHGREARINIETAIRDRIPVFGFEVEPNGTALEQGERKIQHFYLDRVHQLAPIFGLRGADLQDRLQVDEAFFAQDGEVVEDLLDKGTLFELIAPTSGIPGAVSASPAEHTASPEAEASDGDGDGDGDGLFDELTGKSSAEDYALRALPILVAHVFQQRDGVMVTLTYQDLAGLLGRRDKHARPWARGMGYVLGRVSALIEAATADWPDVPPFLTTIVVLKRGSEAGLPDVGVQGKWPGYAELTRADKVAKVNTEHVRIFQFGNRWNDVLESAGMSRIAQPIHPLDGLTKGGWGGGESDAHKALKRYVVDNPQEFGADATWFAQEEFALRSGDEIDVFFRSRSEWVGIEVKSKVSDGNQSDYERGLYQAIKYKSVLEAQARIDHPVGPPIVRVVLVLEGTLPSQFTRIAVMLGVQYMERVSVPQRDPLADIAAG